MNKSATPVSSQSSTSRLLMTYEIDHWVGNLVVRTKGHRSGTCIGDAEQASGHSLSFPLKETFHKPPHPGTWTSRVPDNGVSSCHQSLSLAYAIAFCQDQVSWGDPSYIWRSFPYTPCSGCSWVPPQVCVGPCSANLNSSLSFPSSHLGSCFWTPYLHLTGRDQEVAREVFW